MSRLCNCRLVLLSGLTVLATFIVANQKAHARAQYYKQFTSKYEDVKESKKTKCNICHEGKPKDKKWNNYGTALGKAIAKKNEKDVDKIKEALTKVEKEKSAIKDMTFGDLLKQGKLPASKE